MKIGILTFHRCINYGSYWQAYCLAEGLQQLGHDAVLLDHHNQRINIAEWRCALQPTLPVQPKSGDGLLYKTKIRRFAEAFRHLPLSQPFSITPFTTIEGYDAVMIGSDEVWNLVHPWYGNHRLFFGEGIQTPQLISYAASFGSYSAWWGLGEEWSTYLKNFHSISVRDENSWYLVHHSTGIDPEIVLDPCLQFNITAPPPAEKTERPYLAVYGHNFSTGFVQNVTRYAKQNKLRTISIGYRNDWADEQWLSAGPFEFYEFMQQSAVVATNFFHGCVFALKNRKPFACESSHYRSHKIDSLLKMVGGLNHFCAEGTAYDTVAELLQQPPDDRCYIALDSLRQSSAVFLNKAINLNKEERA